MNGIYKRFVNGNTSSSESDYSRGNGGIGSSMEGSGQSQSRKTSHDGETNWFDWIRPKYREKELKPRFEEALKKLEDITNDLA